MERNRFNGVEFRSPAITIQADSNIIPCARQRETMPITLVPFKDHGRPAYIASTINSREVLKEAAGSLSEAESQRLNEALSRSMEVFLDNGIIKSDATLRSNLEGKPDIHMIIVGNPYQDNSLRLYYHVGQFQGARVIYQDARTTKRGADRIERTLRSDGGYQTPRNWESKSTGRGGR
jgi:hypothetical protein